MAACCMRDSLGAWEPLSDILLERLVASQNQNKKFAGGKRDLSPRAQSPQPSSDNDGV